MARDELKNIDQHALEDEKKQADDGSKVVIQFAYVDEMKKGYEIQGKSLLNLTIGQEQVMGNQLVDINIPVTPQHTREVIN